MFLTIGFAVISNHDHQQEEQFFRRSEHDDVDVNTLPLSFHPVVKDAGDSNVSPGDVVRSSKVHREWNGDQQSKVRCSSSFDMTCVKSCQQCEAQSQKYCRQGGVHYETRGNKKVRIVGCGHFFEETDFAVLTVSANENMSE